MDGFKFLKRMAGNEHAGGNCALMEVEQVLDRREMDGKEAFLVRWRGWGPEGDTWEPRSSFIDGIDNYPITERLQELLLKNVHWK